MIKSYIIITIIFVHFLILLIDAVISDASHQALTVLKQMIRQWREVDKSEMNIRHCFRLDYSYYTTVSLTHFALRSDFIA